MTNRLQDIKLLLLAAHASLDKGNNITEAL